MHFFLMNLSYTQNILEKKEQCLAKKQKKGRIYYFKKKNIYEMS